MTDSGSAADKPPTINPRPWSARRPQSLVLSVVFIIVAVGLIWQALSYIGAGVGGLVPYLILLAGPILCGYYVWYFNFYRFDEPAQQG